MRLKLFITKNRGHMQTGSKSGYIWDTLRLKNVMVTLISNNALLILAFENDNTLYFPPIDWPFCLHKI